MIRNQEGAALVVTLLVVSIMTITVTEFLYATWVDRSLTVNFSDTAKSSYALRAGVEAGRAILREDYREDAKRGLFADTLRDFWAQPALPIPIDDTYLFVSIADESSKIDLNRLITQGGYPDEKWINTFRRLLRDLGEDEDIATYVLDWIDENSEGPAEDGYYQSSSLPYRCKNARLDSVEELKRVRGITPAVFAKLRKFVTIRSAGWVNINTAAAEVLMALDDRISKGTADAVIKARNEMPFKRKEDIKNVGGFEDIFPRIGSMIDVSSNSFSIAATITVGEVNRKAEALVTERNAGGATLLYYREY
ncbi:MAG: type II secretion system minor pseudopilin GspK [Nitrospinae bacterium]|nr:type II secretion system minor pseudopilin GspK [Nitrospinota bacterium]